ncbi:nucleoside hydrolase [Streptomyces sp. NPDC002769]|uniref:nucleoside hydrolase n=1 Tax=Streptomyces sp. NPDC002769 TaxID=3154542 RepID=UPI0033300446
MPKKIIIDCDPGLDDAIAILLAAGNPDVEIVAVTTVAGNHTLDKVTLNARQVCTLAGLHDVPVAAGADRPLVRDRIIAAEIHGESGMDGPDFIAPAMEADPRHAVDLIVETVLTHPGEITLVPTAPLTNIALALRREPRIATLVKEVVLMGGSYTRGNVTPAAEFNVHADPEAAAIVFSADWPVTMVGLDLTAQAAATPDLLYRIAALDTPVSRFVVDLLHRYNATVGKVHGTTATIHDACAVGRAIDPTLMEAVEAHVEVELRGTATYGMTVTDFRGHIGPPNTLVATELHTERLWDLLIRSLETIAATTRTSTGPNVPQPGGERPERTTPGGTTVGGNTRGRV